MTCTTAATTSSRSPSTCEFEEIAYLLIHGKLPNARGARRLQEQAEVAARTAGDACATCSRCCPRRRHPMDVLRTGVSVLGCALPEKRRPRRRRRARHRRPAGRLASARCCATGTTSATTASASRCETDDDSVGGHFLHLLHRRAPPASWVRAMHTSLILYAEHEFNASTFAARVIAGTGADMLLVHHRRDRRAARPEARRRQRGRVRDPEALRHARTRPRPTSARASPPRKSSSASATRCTPSPIRATR